MPKTISTRLAVEGESEYQSALKNVNNELKTLQSELEKTSSEFRDNADSMEALEAKNDVLAEMYEKQQEKIENLQAALDNAKDAHENYGQQIEDLNGQIEEQQAKLEELQSTEGDTTEAQEELSASIEELKSQLEDAEAGFETSGTAVENWQQKLNYAQIDANNLKDTIEQNKAAMEKSGEGADEASGKMGSFGDVMSKAGGMAGNFGSIIQGIATGGMMGLMDAAAQVVEMIIEMMIAFDEANSTLVEKTGASGAALDEFNQIAAETAMVLDEIDVAGAAGIVGELNTRLGLEGEALEKATVLMGKFADVTGTEAEAAVVKMTKVMNKWGIGAENMEGLMDDIVIAGQQTGISFDTLASELIHNKSTFERMDFTIEDSIALLGTFERAGVESGTVMNGLRTATAKWAKEGISAQDGLNDMVTRISAAKDSTEALAIAEEYFSGKTASEFADAVRAGCFEFDNLSAAMENSNGVMMDTEERADTFSEQMGNIGDTIGAFMDEGGPIGVMVDMANNTGAFGTALRGAADEMLGLNDAAQANADMTPEMIEAQQQEQEELKKQAELEEKAAEAYGKVSSSMAEIKDYISDLNAEYEANYQAAYDNINKQIGLFDEMTVGTSKSVDSMLKSLDSQISYMDNYASNMRKAAELGIDEGLLAKLNDGSQESAEILQGIVDDGGEHIEELNEKLAMVEEGKQTFADTYAEIKTGLDDDLKDMIASVEGMVDDLDQSAEAYKNGSMTAQAKYDQVYNAYKKMAERANRAVKNTMDINSPSRVMMQFGEYSGEGFAEGALKELNTVEGAYEKLAKAAMSPLENLDPFGSPTGYAAGDGGYTDNRNMNVQISVASGSPEDKQRVYDYISREFATRSGRRIS